MTNDPPKKSRSPRMTWGQRRSRFLGGESASEAGRESASELDLEGNDGPYLNSESSNQSRPTPRAGGTSPENGPENSADATLESTRPKRKARDKVMDLLARRSYSAFEIRNKLSPYYPSDEIEAAIRFAEDNKWMLPPDEMAARVSVELGRRKKGHRYITQFLKKKGLPQVEKDLDEEVEKALLVIEDKAERLGRRAISSLTEPDPDLDLERPSDASKGYQTRRAEYVERNKKLQKLQATLAGRGFDGDTIGRALRIWRERETES